MCGSRAAAREVMSRRHRSVRRRRANLSAAQNFGRDTVLHSLPLGLHRCRRFLRVGHCGRPRTSTGHVADPPVAITFVIEENFGVTRTSKIGDPNGMLSIDQVAEGGALTDQTPVEFPVGRAPQPPVAVPIVVEHHPRGPSAGEIGNPDRVVSGTVLAQDSGLRGDTRCGSCTLRSFL
jgi:hypothetical protein